MMKNINVYIIHCPSLSNRIALMDDFKKKFSVLEESYKINYKTIIDYKHTDITKEQLSNLVKLEKIENENLQKYNNFIRILTPQTISKSLKHYKVLQEIKNNNSEDINLVIEDDIMVEDTDLPKNFNILIKKLGNDFDICMLGIPSSMENIEKDTYNVIDSKKIYNTLPGSDSYLITSKCATNLVSNFIPIRYEYNIHLTFLAELCNINIKQASPNIFIEASKIGKIKSTTNINNVPIYNFKYKELNSLILKDNLTVDEKDKLQSLLNDEFLSKNPDFIYLKALYQFKLGNYLDSKVLFDEVYEHYKTLNLPISKDSNFLLNFVEIFKFVQ